MSFSELRNLKLSDIPYGPTIFLVIILIATTLPFYNDIYYQIRKKLFKKMTRSEYEDWVEQIYFDLLKEFVRMRDDPFMSDQKWREWLPIFRYADELIQKTFPKIKYRSLGNMVHMIIDNSDEIKI